MRSMRVLGFVAVGSLIVAASAAGGCGGTDTAGSGGATSASASGTGGTTAANGPVVAAVAVTSGSGTTSGSGGGKGTVKNHSFATAAPIQLNASMATSGTLPDPSSSTAFYKFTGSKGQALLIATSAKPSTDPMNVTYLDLYATLYDANQNPIAQQDDPDPDTSNDPALYTVLPADGEYFLEIQECNTAYKDNSVCAPAKNITHFDYTVDVLDLSKYTFGTVESADPDDTTTDPGVAANTVKFAAVPMQPAGTYFPGAIAGTYESGTDVDVYSMTSPTDIKPVAGSRPTAFFYIQPSTVKGDGSTNPPGNFWVTDKMGNVLAQLDDTQYSIVDPNITDNGPATLWAPITFGKEYFLWTQHSSVPLGANDFYVVENLVDFGNPLEAEATGQPNSNDTLATAEPITSKPQMNADGSLTYFIEGDLGAGDPADTFSLPTPGMNTLLAACSAQRLGSGLRGLKWSAFADSSKTAFDSASEAADKDVGLNDKATKNLPAGTASIKLQVTAAGPQGTMPAGTPDAGKTITGTNYVCVITVAKQM